MIMFSIFRRHRKSESKPENPVDQIIRELNQYPIGMARRYNINFGPGLSHVNVLAYFDPFLYQQSGGKFTVLRLDGLPQEFKRFL